MCCIECGVEFMVMLKLGLFGGKKVLLDDVCVVVVVVLYDWMIESVVVVCDDVKYLFDELLVKLLLIVDVLGVGCGVLECVNVELGFVFVDDEIDYLVDVFCKFECNLIDVELMMFV